MSTTATDPRLQHRFHAAYVQLLVWTSPVAAANPARSHSQPASTMLAGRFKGAAHYLEHWEKANSPIERVRIVEEMEAHLKSVRRPEPVRVIEESPTERELRILDATIDWKPDEVATSNLRITAKYLRRLRANYARDTETGKVRENLTPQEQRSEVLRLAGLETLTQYEIARLVGLHRQQVARILGKQARKAA